MDADRFDALSRALSTSHTRRRLTRLLGGLGLGGVLAAFGIDEAAAASRNGGYPCTEGRQCKTGKCLGSGKCSCSKDFPTCKQPSNPCKKATCDFSTKRCITSNKEAGATCPDDGDPCTKNVCDGSGICIHPKEADGTLCPDGTCQDGDCDPCGRIGYWPNQPCCDGPVKCEAGTTCKYGDLATGQDPYCTPCGNQDQLCCDFECTAGLACDWDQTCQPCGNAHQLCCATDQPCVPGTRCVTDSSISFCDPCGRENQPCCEPHFCVEKECNMFEGCTACGGLAEICCVGNRCDVGLRCNTDWAICENAPA